MARRKGGRGPGRPPRAEAGEGDSRVRLLDAAAKVFAERGYKSASVDAVVAEAGLSKGTFYWNFDSKEELFFALLDERIDQPFRAMMDFVRAAPADAVMSPLADIRFAAMVEHQRPLLLLMHEYWSVAVRDERLRERYVAWYASLREMISATLAARHEVTGVPAAIPVEHMATAFIALGAGLSLEAVIDPDAVPGDLLGEIASLIYDGQVLRAQRAEAEAEAEAEGGAIAAYQPSRSSRRSISSACPRTSRSRAVVGSTHAARSISGNSDRLPDRGGHSITKCCCAAARVEVAFDRPREDALPAGLADLAQLQRRPVRRGTAGLLLELAPCREERILAVVELALRD